MKNKVQSVWSMECTVESKPHDIPHFPRNLHVVTLDAALTMRFAKKKQHHTSKVLCLSRKMTGRSPKCCLCHKTCNSSWEAPLLQRNASTEMFEHEESCMEMKHVRSLKPAFRSKCQNILTFYSSPHVFLQDLQVFLMKPQN